MYSLQEKSHFGFWFLTEQLFLPMRNDQGHIIGRRSGGHCIFPVPCSWCFIPAKTWKSAESAVENRRHARVCCGAIISHLASFVFSPKWLKETLLAASAQCSIFPSIPIIYLKWFFKTLFDCQLKKWFLDIDDQGLNWNLHMK